MNHVNCITYKLKSVRIVRFQKDFPNWTSRNKFIEKFIQETQPSSEEYQVLEWIPYDRLEDVKFLVKGDLVRYTKPFGWMAY